MRSRKFVHKLLTIFAVFSFLFLTACSSKNNKEDSSSASSDAYHQVDAETAKQMIDKEEQNVTIVDVRTLEEYNEGHLPEALLVPLATIGDDMPEALPDKDAVLIVYCRSGRRSKDAADKLVTLGYQNVYDMGGIIDWPYDTIAE